MQNNILSCYSTGSKFFHWLIALLVLLMLGGSFFLDDVPKPYEGLAVMIHKSIGLTILVLMILRIVWIVRAGKPALPFMPKWQKILARSVQHSLYLLLILMPLTGWIMSTAAGRSPLFFGLFTVPFPGIPLDKNLSHNLFTTHQIIAWLLIALVTIHIIGAFKHLLLDKDNVMRSMWFKKKMR